jgi:hypothetical protein
MATVHVEADKVEAERLEIRLSDEIRLTVSVEGGSSLEVQPLEAITTSPDWQARTESGTEKPGLIGHWQQTFRLSPLKPGEQSLVLTPLRFRSSPEAPWEEVSWRPILVHVSTEIYRADLHELRPIAPPEELPPAPSWKVPLPWASLALGLVVLLLSGWALLRRRPRQSDLPPGQWALRELESIPLPADSTEYEVKHFYTRLSNVLRRYFELRFHVPAPEQTTAEFLEAMHRSPHLQPEQQAVLRDIMQQCDLVKFARAQSSAQECRTVAEIARAIVEQTVTNGIATSATPPVPQAEERSTPGTGCD